MKEIINTTFFNSILQYNEQNKERIKEICSPLKSCLGIPYFGYCRIFNDGRYILVSNCTAWKENSFFYDNFLNTKFFRTFPIYLSKYKTLRTIWPENTEDETIEFLNFKKVFNYFSIEKENAGTLECYFFGTAHHSPLMIDFYNSHSESLEAFISYFKRIACDLIDPTAVNRQGIYPFVRDNYPQIETIFKNRTPWEEKIIKFNALLNSNLEEEIREIGKRHLLSYRELECLSHSSTGMTAKEIARALGIGYRTVETHLNNIRLKTGCQTKRELTYWFEEKFKYFLTTQ